MAVSSVTSKRLFSSGLCACHELTLIGLCTKLLSNAGDPEGKGSCFLVNCHLQDILCMYDPVIIILLVTCVHALKCEAREG